MAHFEPQCAGRRAAKLTQLERSFPAPLWSMYACLHGLLDGVPFVITPPVWILLPTSQPKNTIGTERGQLLTENAVEGPMPW